MSVEDTSSRIQQDQQHQQAANMSRESVNGSTKHPASSKEDLQPLLSQDTRSQKGKAAAHAGMAHLLPAITYGAP